MVGSMSNRVPILRCNAADRVAKMRVLLPHLWACFRLVLLLVPMVGRWTARGRWGQPAQPGLPHQQQAATSIFSPPSSCCAASASILSAAYALLYHLVIILIRVIRPTKSYLLLGQSLVDSSSSAG